MSNPPGQSPFRPGDVPQGLQPFQPTPTARRFSYASVVQGQQSQASSSSSRPPVGYTGSHTRRSHGGSLDAEMAGSSGLSGSWGRTGYLGSTGGGGGGSVGGGSYGGPFAGLNFGAGVGAAALPGAGEEIVRLPPFFVPSYLKGTRHARRLEDAHNARLTSHLATTRSPHSSAPPSLSTSSSSQHIHKMVPSHRGMTHDIIERAAPATAIEEAPAPLPTRWVVGQDAVHIDVSEGGLEARYTGSGSRNADEASCVRGDVPIPRECGVFYYEVTVISKNRGRDLQMSIGLSGHKVTSRRPPGWEPDSYGFTSDDGHLLLGNSSTPKKYSHPYGSSDVIGCGINFHKNTLFFTKNGNFLGPVTTNIRHDKLYPAVGLKKGNDTARVNFGQTEFVFDIDTFVQLEKEEVRLEMMAAPVGQLSPPLTEPQIIHKLIAQYLAHDGYIETARAFAAEVRQEHQSLAIGTTSADSSSQDLEPEEDVDAIHRQKIRSAILDGEVERALKYTNVYYPDVLHENENIYFKLKCRKYVEMIRRCAELSDSDVNPIPTKLPATAPADDDYNGVFDHQMELDGNPATSNTNGKWEHGDLSGSAMETSTDDLRYPVTYTEMITKTMAYGQELKAEFDSDVRREVKKVLEETLALIGYEDPRTSPLKHLLDERERAPVAEELNRAILVSLGKSSSSAIENVFAQTDVLLDIIGKDGGPGAFVDLRSSTTRSGRPL